MTLIDQLKMLLDNEALEVLEQEIMSETLVSKDKNLEYRYKSLLDNHKNLLRVVTTLIGDISSKSNEVLTNKAIVEQNYYKLKKRNMELYHMCAFDALTEVYSRKYVLEALEKVHRESLRNNIDYAVVMVDIDDFKKVNDGYGHPVGDQVLKSVAKTLENHLRPDDIVGRLGGDEFIVVLPDTSETMAQEVVSRLNQQIEGIVFECDSRTIKVTASFGLYAHVSPYILDCEEVIYYADNALLHAKQSGKNQVQVYKDNLVVAI